MSICKEKSRKSSIKGRTDVRVAAQLSLMKACPTSTEQIAERFCDEMIQNLKRNVAENKHRLAL
jgi:hypothetical protein